VMSALLFGFLHVLISLFQQLFNATLLGIILGMLAIRSGSILPGIVFHFLNNGLAVAQGSWLAEPSSRPVAVWLYRDLTEGLYHWWWIVLSALISGALLVVLRDGEPLEPRPGRVAGDPAEPLVAMSDAR
jgi:sodium transport system permease protein